MKETTNLRAKVQDTIVRIIEQWLAGGNIKVGQYKFQRSEIALRIDLDRINSSDFEKIVAEPEIEHQNGSEIIR